MPTYRRRSSSRSTRRPRIRTTWNQSFHEFVQTGGAQQTVFDISHPLITDNETSGGTCLRLIGDLRFENGGASADHITLGIGISVVTADSIFSSAAIPDPLADFRQDWYFWRASAWHLSPAGDPTSFVSIPIDIRSSRRIREGFRLAAIVDKAVTTETSWNLVLSLRTLWTLQA